jgi:hypothetical protein
MRAPCPDCNQDVVVTGGNFAHHVNNVDLRVCAGVDKPVKAPAKKAPAKKTAAKKG